MSGGHWDRCGNLLDDLMQVIGQDEAVRRRWPQTAAVFRVLGPLLRQAEHEMDWDLSKDILIDDDAAFDEQTAAKIARNPQFQIPNAYRRRTPDMTRQQIADGLECLAEQLANDRHVPEGWESHEWAYVKGVASGEILRLRDRLVAARATVEAAGPK